MQKRIWTDADRFRYYLFEIYEESAPEDWERTMRESHLEFAVSPWHRDDVKEDGTPKKPHKHVIWHTSGNNPQKVSKARDILCGLGLPANGHIEPAFNPKGSMRYLIHLDDPEKSQYEGGRNAITLINGFPLDLSRQLTGEQLKEVRKRVFEICKEYAITEYAELLDMLLWGLGLDDEFDYASTHTVMFKGYLDSKRNSGRV